MAFLSEKLMGEPGLLPHNAPGIVMRFLAFLFLPILLSVAAYSGLILFIVLLVPSGAVLAFGLFVVLFLTFAIYVYDPSHSLITTKVTKLLETNMILTVGYRKGNRFRK
jgi:hypothetical protein